MERISSFEEIRTEGARNEDVRDVRPGGVKDRGLKQ